MPDRPITTVLFDLDGTLTDSEAGIVAGLRYALTAVGAPEPPAAVVADVAGPPMFDTLTSLGLEGNRRDAALAAYSEQYDAVGWAQNSVFDGIEDLLAELRATGLRLAVATSKAESRAVRILEHFGLAGYFEVIAGASADGTRRAKADVIARALSGLGIAPDDAAAGVLMVGDREHDVAGAARFAIPVVFVGWGYGRPAEADDADWTVHSVAELRKVIMDLTRTEPAVTAPDPEPGPVPPVEALHVSFICTGNICRSPMAEKIFAEHLRRAGLGDRVRVSSAGTSGWHIGDDADERTNVVLRAHGYPTGHAAAQVDDDHLDADLLLAMDTGHLRALLGLGADPERVRLLRSFDPDADGDEVADPYYGGADEFERVRVEIEAAVPGLLGWVRERL